MRRVTPFIRGSSARVRTSHDGPNLEGDPAILIGAAFAMSASRMRHNNLPLESS